MNSAEKLRNSNGRIFEKEKDQLTFASLSRCWATPVESMLTLTWRLRASAAAISNRCKSCELRGADRAGAGNGGAGVGGFGGGVSGFGFASGLNGAKMALRSMDGKAPEGRVNPGRGSTAERSHFKVTGMGTFREEATLDTVGRIDWRGSTLDWASSVWWYSWGRVAESVLEVLCTSSFRLDGAAGLGPTALPSASSCSWSSRYKTSTLIWRRGVWG